MTIRRAFGPLLATVSVKRAVFSGFKDDGGNTMTGFRVHYTLVGCKTPVTTYARYLEDSALIPPYTFAFDNDEPADLDKMSATRFRELLRLYGTVSERPFGGLRSYRGSGADIGAQDTTDTVGGTVYAIGDLWVVTPGFTSQKQFGGDPYIQPGYVFLYPVGAAPRFVGVVKDLGQGPDLGD